MPSLRTKDDIPKKDRCKTKNSWWYGDTHNWRQIENTHLPEYEILEETKYATHKARLRYERCVWCGEICSSYGLFDTEWVWKKHWGETDGARKNKEEAIDNE